MKLHVFGKPNCEAAGKKQKGVLRNCLDVWMEVLKNALEMLLQCFGNALIRAKRT